MVGTRTPLPSGRRGATRLNINWLRLGAPPRSKSERYFPDRLPPLVPQLSDRVFHPIDRCISVPVVSMFRRFDGFAAILDTEIDVRESPAGH